MNNTFDTLDLTEEKSLTEWMLRIALCLIDANKTEAILRVPVEDETLCVDMSFYVENKKEQ